MRALLNNNNNNTSKLQISAEKTLIVEYAFKTVENMNIWR